MSFTITVIPMVQAPSPVLSAKTVPPITSVVIETSQEDEPATPPSLDPPAENQLTPSPSLSLPLPSSSPENALLSLKLSPKVVINGIAPHVLDERKSRPRTPVQRGKGPSGSVSKRNLRRLQYIQQCQEQLQLQQQRTQQQSQYFISKPSSSAWPGNTGLCQRFVLESSPLRVLGSCTFEDLQAQCQLEFVVDTKESSRSENIPPKNEVDLGSTGNVKGGKSISGTWSFLKIHLDTHIFRSIMLRIKQRT